MMDRPVDMPILATPSAPVILKESYPSIIRCPGREGGSSRGKPAEARAFYKGRQDV